MRDEAARRSAIAQFIHQTAVQHGVHVSIVPGPVGGATVFAWAPTATSDLLQAEAERSFKRAVEQNIGAVRRYADSLRARPRTLGN